MRKSTCCRPSSHSSRAVALTRPRSCWRPPADSNRWTSPSRGRRTWTRSPRRCSAPDSTAASGCARSQRPRGPRRARRLPSRPPRICCWTRWSPSPTTTRRRSRCCREAVQRLAGEKASPKERLRWLWQGCVVALEIWDDEHARSLSQSSVEIARDTGTLSELALALSARAPDSRVLRRPRGCGRGGFRDGVGRGGDGNPLGRLRRVDPFGVAGLARPRPPS